MNRKHIERPAAALLLLALGVASAQDAAEEEDDSLPDEARNGLEVAAEKVENLPAEATIRLLEDADAQDIDAIMHEVELPVLPEEAASGQQGLDTAAQATANGEAFGRRIAEEARDNAANAAENAQERAEDRGRAENLPPDVPGRPNLPDKVPDGVPGPPGG